MILSAFVSSNISLATSCRIRSRAFFSLAKKKTLKEKLQKADRKLFFNFINYATHLRKSFTVNQEKNPAKTENNSEQLRQSQQRRQKINMKERNRDV
jgi:hypothetical protein